MANTTETPELETERNIVFAAPADDPRARRPADVATLVSLLLLTLLLGWIHRAGSDLDGRVRDLAAGELPGWLTGSATIVFIVGGLYTFGLLFAIAIFGEGRSKIARDMLAAGVLAALAVTVFAYLGGPEFPDLIPELFERGGVPSYPVSRLAISVAVLGVAGPYLSLPMRKVGKRLIVAMSLSALIMTYGTLTGVIGGVVLGSAVAAAVHLIFGSGLGIPSKARIRSALVESGLDATEIEYLDQHSIGATLVRATLTTGDTVEIKVYGRDSANAAFATRLWRTLWYRNNHRTLTTTSEQLAEHESLILLATNRFTGPAPEFVGLSRTSIDDSLVLTKWTDGTRLDELSTDDISDRTLDEVWAALAEIHQAGIAHREIDRSKIVIVDDRIVFSDYSGGRIMADADTRHTDQAQLLVATAIAVGQDRAIEAGRRSLGDDGILLALPLLQGAALTRDLQQDARASGIKLGDMRGRAADLLGAPAPDTAQLERVSWGTVAMVVLTLFAAYSLITALTDIGLDTIANEVADAKWSWIAVAFVMAQLTNVGEYVSLAGMVGKSIPFGPTIMFRYALSFISLAVPSAAGEVAMNIRYQKKLGVPAAAAVAQGPLLTIISKAFDLVLLFITARMVTAAVDWSEIDAGPIFRLIGLVVVAAVIAVVTVLAVPKLRKQMLPHLAEGFSAVRGALTDPERLLRVVGGTIMQKILFALTLAASVAAYGSGITFAEAVFINTAISLLVGLMPVPGGIGVSEAALTAGLIAVGVPAEVAAAAAITHRMVTAYIPPTFGWWASRWLTDRDYL